MSIFDSIIGESGAKYGLNDTASGSLLSSLLGLIADQTQGGFGSFLDRFRRVGLGEIVDSWVGTGANRTLSGEQVESALGTETVGEMARQAGTDAATAQAALGTMIPGVVDRLTPDGTIPTDDDLLSRIGGFLSGVGGGEVVSTTGVMANEAVADRIGTAAAAENIDRHSVGDLIETETADDSPLKWLLPLIIFGLLVAGGWMFCGGKQEAPPTPPAAVKPANANVNAAGANGNNANR